MARKGINVLKSFRTCPRTVRSKPVFGFSSHVIIAAALAIAFIALFSYASLYVRAQGETASGEPQNRKLEFVPGELLVRFRPSSEFAKAKDKVSLQLSIQGRSVPLQVERFGGFRSRRRLDARASCA